MLLGGNYRKEAKKCFFLHLAATSKKVEQEKSASSQKQKNAPGNSPLPALGHAFINIVLNRDDNIKTINKVNKAKYIHKNEM